MKVITVDEYDKEERLDKYLGKHLNISRRKIQQLITNKCITVNNNYIKSNYLVKMDDIITIKGPVTTDIEIKPQNIPLDIVYEDDYLLVVNKPSGMLTHPAPGYYRDTLVNALLHHTSNLSNLNGDVRPGVVHRLDKDTSGLLIVAKTNDVHLKLAKDLQKRNIKRIYQALVTGVIINDTGTIDAPIGRDIKNPTKMTVTNLNVRQAVTHFKVIERYKSATLVTCKLDTGRTHQIRVHFNYIGHPIINDPVYGSKPLIDQSGQMLCAKEIGFTHPITKQYLEFTISLPEKIEQTISKYQAEL